MRFAMFQQFIPEGLRYEDELHQYETVFTKLTSLFEALLDGTLSTDFIHEVDHLYDYWDVIRQDQKDKVAKILDPYGLANLLTKDKETIGRFLYFISDIYQIKGTFKALKYALSLVGWDAEVIQWYKAEEYKKWISDPQSCQSILKLFIGDYPITTDMVLVFERLVALLTDICFKVVLWVLVKRLVDQVDILEQIPVVTAKDAYIDRYSTMSFLVSDRGKQGEYGVYSNPLASMRTRRIGTADKNFYNQVEIPDHNVNTPNCACTETYNGAWNYTAPGSKVPLDSLFQDNVAQLRFIPNPVIRHYQYYQKQCLYDGTYRYGQKLELPSDFYSCAWVKDIILLPEDGEQRIPVPKFDGGKATLSWLPSVYYDKLAQDVYLDGEKDWLVEYHPIVGFSGENRIYDGKTTYGRDPQFRTYDKLLVEQTDSFVEQATVELLALDTSHDSFIETVPKVFSYDGKLKFGNTVIAGSTYYEELTSSVQTNYLTDGYRRQDVRYHRIGIYKEQFIHDYEFFYDGTQKYVQPFDREVWQYRYGTTLTRYDGTHHFNDGTTHKPIMLPHHIEGFVNYENYNDGISDHLVDAEDVIDLYYDAQTDFFVENVPEDDVITHVGLTSYCTEDGWFGINHSFVYTASRRQGSELAYSNNANAVIHNATSVYTGGVKNLISSYKFQIAYETLYEHFVVDFAKYGHGFYDGTLTFGGQAKNHYSGEGVRGLNYIRHSLFVANHYVKPEDTSVTFSGNYHKDIQRYIAPVQITLVDKLVENQHHDYLSDMVYYTDVETFGGETHLMVDTVETDNLPVSVTHLFNLDDALPLNYPPAYQQPKQVYDGRVKFNSVYHYDSTLSFLGEEKPEQRKFDFKTNGYLTFDSTSIYGETGLNYQGNYLGKNVPTAYISAGKEIGVRDNPISVAERTTMIDSVSNITEVVNLSGLSISLTEQSNLADNHVDQTQNFFTDSFNFVESTTLFYGDNTARFGGSGNTISYSTGGVNTATYDNPNNINPKTFSAINMGRYSDENISTDILNLPYVIEPDGTKIYAGDPIFLRELGL